MERVIGYARGGVTHPTRLTIMSLRGQRVEYFGWRIPLADIEKKLALDGVDTIYLVDYFAPGSATGIARV